MNLPVNHPPDSWVPASHYTAGHYLSCLFYTSRLALSKSSAKLCNKKCEAYTTGIIFLVMFIIYKMHAI